MPVIKVWCLPKTSESKLNRLHLSIVQAFTEIVELDVKSEKDITCLFPSDMMEYGLGTEIVIEVTGLFENPNRTDDVRGRLAENLVRAIREHFPDAEMVECFIYPFNPSQGFCSSRKIDEQ